MAFALDEQPSAAGNTVLTDWLAKHSLYVQNSLLRFNPHLRLTVVSAQRNGIAVAVVEDGVVLADSAANDGTHRLIAPGQRPQMLTFFLKNLSRNALRRSMHLCIRGTRQPIQTATIENVVIHKKTVAQKIALYIFYRVFNFSLALGIGSTAHIDGHFRLLPELLKFVGVENISGIFAYTHNAVLVKNHFTRQPAEVSETVVARVYQVCRCKRTALHFGIFVSGCGKQKRCCVDSGLPAVNIGHQELTEVNLHLLPHRKLGNSFIVS